MSETSAQFSQGPLLLSWPGLVASVTIALGLLLTTALWVSPALLTGGWANYLIRDELDDYAFASSEILKMRAQPRGIHGAVLVGTAAMREGLLNQADASRLLSEQRDLPLEVLALMTGGQSALEMTALAVELAPHLDGVLVLGVSPSRLAANPAELASLVRNPRLAFQSEAFDDEARASGHVVATRRGNYLLDNYPFFVARYWDAIGHLLLGPVKQWNTHPYLDKAPKDEAAWRADAQVLKRRLASYEQHAERNLAAYGRLLDKLAAYPSVKVLLLDIPLNPRAVREVFGSDFYAQHRARIAAFAQQRGALYLNLNDVPGLAESDFQDWSHIRSARAQRLLSERLFETVTQQLRKQ
jgi:hypothetical protein